MHIYYDDKNNIRMVGEKKNKCSKFRCVKKDLTDEELSDLLNRDNDRKIRDNELDVKKPIKLKEKVMKCKHIKDLKLLLIKYLK